MSVIPGRLSSIVLVFSVVMGLPVVVQARTNQLTSGGSLALDINRRQYSEVDNDKQVDKKGQVDKKEAIEEREDVEDYRKVSVTPFLHYMTEAANDFFEIELRPSFKYDLVNSEKDWDANLLVKGKKKISKNLSANISDSFIRSDYFHKTNERSVAQSRDIALSADLGRQRYKNNRLEGDLVYTYGEGREGGLGAKYHLLRNDDSVVTSYKSYDRYEVFVTNKYRFDSTWGVDTTLSFVRGEYDLYDSQISQIAEGKKSDKQVAGSEEEVNQFSNDVREYRADVSIESAFTRRSTFYLTYGYVGVRYDEATQNDSDGHQLQLGWNQDVSKRTKISLSIGPSYEKVNKDSSTWDWAGSLNYDYSTETGGVRLTFDKGYDVDNFSGDDKKGVLEYLGTQLSGQYRLFENVSGNASLAYRYEKGEFEEHNYTGGLGLNYSFARYYSAAINYSYTKLDAEQDQDDYDDHRVFFSLSWKKPLVRW